MSKKRKADSDEKKEEKEIFTFESYLNTIPIKDIVQALLVHCIRPLGLKKTALKLEKVKTECWVTPLVFTNDKGETFHLPFYKTDLDKIGVENLRAAAKQLLNESHFGGMDQMKKRVETIHETKAKRRKTSSQKASATRKKSKRELEQSIQKVQQILDTWHTCLQMFPCKRDSSLASSSSTSNHAMDTTADEDVNTNEFSTRLSIECHYVVGEKEIFTSGGGSPGLAFVNDYEKKTVQCRLVSWDKQMTKVPASRFYYTYQYPSNGWWKSRQPPSGKQMIKCPQPFTVVLTEPIEFEYQDEVFDWKTGGFGGREKRKQWVYLEKGHEITLDFDKHDGYSCKYESPTGKFYWLMNQRSVFRPWLLEVFRQLHKLTNDVEKIIVEYFE